MNKLKNRIEKLKMLFKNNEELKVRQFSAFKTKFALIYLESFADFDVISKDIIKPIIESNKDNETLSFKELNKKKTQTKKENIKKNESEIENKFIEFIALKVLYASEVTTTKKEQEIVSKLTRGEKVLLVDNIEEVILINAKKLEKRTIVEPPNNNVVRGPREGFIEDINSNLNLIRKRLVTNDLKIETMEIGRYTKTKVAVCYLTKIADLKVVKKIKERLEKIDIDGIIDSYYLQDYLEEHPTSIFKQIGFTEKPDMLVGKMLEGRVGIIVDGSPMVLTLPFILMEDLQSPGDYYEENNSVTFVRMIRFLGIFIALTMPGIYISLQLYHYKALPLKFLVTIMNSSQNIPMPPAIEVLFTFFMFEILYEASVRTPKSLGSSFNIIGALILGDTAVKSNLASAPTIMVVALSSIAIYLIPEGTNVLRLLRFALTLMATILGVVGICVGLIFIVGYLCDFDSYGADYFAPWAPYLLNDFKDTFYKGNIINMKNRPKSLRPKNNIRQVIDNDTEK